MNAMQMKWRKLGRIFDPAGHELPDGCTEFAQSPQALVLKDRVRVYFSTRRRDQTGKFLSHVAYADFTRDMRQLLDVSRHTVLPLGALGCFDEHGIFPLSPCRLGDRIVGYTTGWNRKVSVPADSSIGLVTSDDNGNTFARHGTGPVVTSSLHEPFLVADAFVLSVGTLLHMWYIFGTAWTARAPGEPPERVYKIGHATSMDGVAWRKEGRRVVDDRIGENECQALPTVIRIDGRYHMLFCFRRQFGFRDDPGSAYRVGHAMSDDLGTWTRDDDVLALPAGVAGEWDHEMQAYPSTFECDGQIYLLYNGNQFGRYGFGLAILER